MWGAAELWHRLKNNAYSSEKESLDLESKIKGYYCDEVGEVSEKNELSYIFECDETWPRALSNSTPAPLGLIYKGDPTTFQEIEKSISLVGTRNPTRYGERIAGEFAASLVDHEWICVSGGALGIDSAVHRGALLAEGRTVAILASSLDKPYPSSHYALFRHISESGLVVSEYPIGSVPYPSHFLHRNRLIAAISRATVVVEAPYKSGALATARFANEYLKPVYGVPGPITSPASEGVHQLIIENQAALIVSASDLISLL
jgi:DNA processing protein